MRLSSDHSHADPLFLASLVFPSTSSTRHTTVLLPWPLLSGHEAHLLAYPSPSVWTVMRLSVVRVGLFLALLSIAAAMAPKQSSASRGRVRAGLPLTSNRSSSTSNRSSFFASDGRRDLQHVDVFALGSVGPGGRATPTSARQRLTLLQSPASRGRGRPGRPSTSNRSFFAIEGRRDLQSVEV